MTIDELRTFLDASKQWKLDRWGHYQTDNYRIKLQTRSVRLEKRIELSCGRKEWIRVRGAYYSQLSIVNGKLAGLTR